MPSARSSNEYIHRKGEIITGIARRIERGNLVIDLGKTDALLPRSEIIPGEQFKPGDRVQAYLSDVVLTASGTATVQAALHDTPMVVVYRLSGIEYALGKRFVSVSHYAMVNLIAGERLVPELIQDAFTPDAVAAEAVSMLTDPARAAHIRAGLARVRARLGAPGASRRAAQAILNVAAVQ